MALLTFLNPGGYHADRVINCDECMKVLSLSSCTKHGICNNIYNTKQLAFSHKR